MKNMPVNVWLIINQIVWQYISVAPPAKIDNSSNSLTTTWVVLSKFSLTYYLYIGHYCQDTLGFH